MKETFGFWGTKPCLKQLIRLCMMPTGFTIDKSLPKRKRELLAYLRERSDEFAADISQKIGTSRKAAVAKGIVSLLRKEEDQLLSQVQQQGRLNEWPNDIVLPASLLIAH